MPVRAFVAIPLPDELTRRAAGFCRELAVDLPGVRWLRPQAMHLTLRFFAAVAEESLEKIGEVMLSVGRLHPPFQMPVTGAGAFPSPARPRVLWLGLRQTQPLLDLQSALERGLAQAGFPGEERPFSPHLTLGRCRGPAPAARKTLDRYRDLDFGLLEVDTIVLFESRLHPAGAVHLPRKTVPLGP